MTRANTISKKISVKTSTAKPLGKSQTGDKNLRIEPSISLYDIEDGDYTEEGEGAEILVVHESIIEASKQNLVKRKFP